VYKRQLLFRRYKNFRVLRQVN